MPNLMPALTLRQPWAFCVGYGNKRVENRTWKPPQGITRLAIHAGARSGWDDDAGYSPLVRAAIGSYVARLDQLGTRAAQRTVSDIMDFGAVVAVADLTGSHWPESRTRAGRLCDPGALCSPWAVPGQCHWELDSVRVLPRPVPCRGSQRIWYLPGDVATAVRAQLTEDRAAGA